MVFFRKDRERELDTDLKLAFSRQSAPTSPQTPNQISEMGRLLNSGLKNVEVGALQPDTFETIPTQHFKEMKRLAEITESKVSMHAPLVDPAGFTQQGWSEDNRTENERYMESVIDKAYLINPKGNIPVNIHTTLGVPGSTKYLEEGKEVEHVMHVVDQEQGRIIPLKQETKHYIGGDTNYTPQEQLEMLNRSSWDQEKLKIASYQKAKQEILQMNDQITKNPLWLELNIMAQNEKKGMKMGEEEKRELRRFNHQLEINMRNLQNYERELNSELNGLHNKYISFRGKPKSREEEKVYNEWTKRLETLGKEFRKPEKELEVLNERLKSQLIKPEEYEKKYKEIEKKIINSDRIWSELSQLPAPRYYMPAEEFAKEKSIETFSNVALNSYKKYGNNAPIISLENFMPTTVLSRADSMRDLIKTTRSKFAEKLSKEKGISEKEAKKVAEKLIGATWDVGHIHQLRKQGYTDKELIEETKKIAPYIKHVHLTDNFGYGDSHLPLGMGDVPIKQHLKELEKAGVKDAINVIESGAYPAHFKQNPLPQSMDYLNSPVYSYEMSPNWGDARDMYASYLVGYGDILPQKHFDTFFGGGFSRLPKELGGQHQANKSSFSGTPMQ